MKKLLVLAAIAGGVLFVIKRNKDAQAEADLWREATAPGDVTLGSVSANGAAPSPAPKPASNN
ncbi:MAG: DLW-39 family protein [Haloechinothrix sp.]